MPEDNSRLQPLAAIVLGAVFISFSSVWVTWSGVDPAVSAFYRVFFGSALLIAACAFRREFHRIPTKTAMITILCGMCFAADLYCWHVSIRFIGPGLATIISNFQVFVLSLVSFVFFGQTIRLRFFLSLPLAFAGLTMIVGVNWSSLPKDYQTGIYFGLATAFFYSVFLLVLRRLQQTERSISFFYSLMLVSISSSVILAMMIAGSGISFRISGPVSIGSLFGLALFSQTVGWTFITNSLPRVIPSLAGLVLLLQPALAFIWDVLIFNRPTTTLNWFGVATTLGAIYLGMSATASEQKTEPGSTGNRRS